MGYEILYCAQCQAQVRGIDLERGSALRYDGNVYCAKCSPAFLKTLPLNVQRDLERARPPVARKSSSTRIAAQSGHTSGIKKIPPAQAPPPADHGKLWMGLGAAVAAGAIVLAIVFLTSGPDSKSVPAPPRPPERETPPRKAAGASESFEGQKALADLEAQVASKAEPLDILMRCQEIRPLVRWPKGEARLKEIEQKATEAKGARDQDRQVDMGLDQVRSIRSFDPRYERRGEVERLLERTAQIPGTRQAAIRIQLASYRQEADAFPRLSAGMVAWYRFSSSDALGRDSSGRGNDALGVAGAVWNGSSAEPGPGIKFDGTGGMSVPISIQSDFSISLWLKTRQLHGGGKQWFDGVGLVDAEVPGAVEDFGTALLGRRFAFGVGAPDTTWTSKTEINDDRWHHLAATRADATGEIRIYVDGLREASATGPKGIRSAPKRLMLGSLQTDLNRFEGVLDDIRLFSRVLGDADIAELAKLKGAKAP